MNKNNALNKFSNFPVRGITWLAILSSTGTLLASLVGIGQNAARAPSLRFEPNPLVVPEPMQSGQDYNVAVAIVNDTSQPARIVGALDFCSGSCYSARGIPTAVPARGRGRIIVHIAAGRPGPCTEQLTFFTDQPSQPTVKLTVNGEVQGVLPHEATDRTERP